jgi:hypothetical protein
MSFQKRIQRYCLNEWGVEKLDSFCLPLNRLMVRLRSPTEGTSFNYSGNKKSPLGDLGAEHSLTHIFSIFVSVLPEDNKILTEKCRI